MGGAAYLLRQSGERRTPSTSMAAVSLRHLSLSGPGHCPALNPPNILAIPRPDLCPPVWSQVSAATLRFRREDGLSGSFRGMRMVPELFDVLFIASQKLLFPLQPVLELRDLVEHQIEVSLPKLVDSLPLFGGEVFHGHVTCHIFDVHQAPECFAHIHVL